MTATATELPELDAVPDLSTAGEWQPAPGSDTPPAEPDTKPRRSRPSTRAGRRAASQAKAAAKSTGSDKPPTRPKASAGTSARQVADAVTGLHQLAGGVALPMANLPSTGAAMLATAEQAGAVWGELSKRYPLIVKLFTGAGDGMLFVQLVMVYLPVIQAAMAESGTPKDQRQAAAAAMMSEALSGLMPQPAGG